MDRPPDDIARQRFMVINALRLAGVALILLAIAIANGLIDLPRIVAYVLAGVGMIDVFVMPQVLARKWRSRDQ